MRKILVTAISGDVANGVLKCLRDFYPDDSIIGCDVNQYPCGLDKVNDFFRSVYYFKTEEYLSLIRDNCIKFGITHLIPCNEGEISVFHKNRNIFNDLGVKVIINNELILNTFLSKYNTAKFLKDNGLPYPRTYKLSEYKGDLQFPIIIKSDSTSGSKSLFIVNGQEELNFYAKKCTDPVLQEYLNNKEEEYTVGVYSNRKETHTIIFKRELASGGYTKQIELAYIDAVEKIAHQIVKKTELYGSINLQLRKHDEEYIIFEINPRISGTSFFRHQLGFMDTVWWLENMDNQQYSPNYIPEYKRAIGVRELSEKIILKEHMNEKGSNFWDRTI